MRETCPHCNRRYYLDIDSWLYHHNHECIPNQAGNQSNPFIDYPNTGKQHDPPVGPFGEYKRP